MLPLPILDNENFEEIMEEAIRKIPGLTSEWTDFNYHDPGITILQLMAWLKETQQFYTDSIGLAHRLKYLKLLGCRPLKEAPAHANVIFSGIRSDTILPEGTKLDANGICFETESPLMLLDNEIMCVQSVQKGQIIELFSISEHENKTGEYVFGRSPEQGNALLLGFKKPLPVGREISLLVTLSDRAGMKFRRNPGKPEYPLAFTCWEYWDGFGWRSVKLTQDQTDSFIMDGYIKFSLEGPMKADQHPPAEAEQGTVQAQAMSTGEPLCWLRCTLVESFYSIAPFVESISINSVQAYQKDTLCEYQEFDGTGEAVQSIDPKRFLQLSGNIEVQVYEDGWWRTCYSRELPDGRCSIAYHENGFVKQILFSQEHGCVPAKGKGNIRIISWNPQFSEKMYLSGSTGLPSQEFETGMEQLLEDSFEIQTGELYHGEMCWRDWRKTDDLMAANQKDNYYTLDALNGIVCFGDGECGVIPPKGEKNIRIISCAVTQGARGNVRDHEISSIMPSDTAIDRELAGIQVYNSRYAEGGRNPETIESAILRFRKGFHVPERAVTSADYEAIVKATPGLLIDKVKAIPNYLVKSNARSLGKGINCVTVVVKPFSMDTAMPVINPAYRKNILAQMEKCRMITTQTDVVSPRYFGLDVYCMLVVKPYYKDAEKSVRAFFERQLNETDSTRGFGTGVVFGEIYGRLESLDCVDRITSLSIEPHESGFVKKAGGDIEIPPDGLIYLRSVTLDIKERMG